MGILTEPMQQLVREHRLGFVATVDPDGTPNLSPKGTTTVWDDDHLLFADLRSPQTMANLERNPVLEINVVDVFTRKGFRFKGRATIVRPGPRFEELLAVYRRPGANLPEAFIQRIRALVLVKVERALPVISPAYDLGITEAELAHEWEEYWAALRAQREQS